MCIYIYTHTYIYMCVYIYIYIYAYSHASKDVMATHVDDLIWACQEGEEEKVTVGGLEYAKLTINRLMSWAIFSQAYGVMCHHVNHTLLH